jgi:hypothetical protein
MHISTTRKLEKAREGIIADLDEQMVETDFEPTVYCKYWAKSTLDHWATIAVVPMSDGLSTHELAFRALLCQIITTFVSFWIGALPRSIGTDLPTRRAADNICVQLHGAIPLSTSLNVVLPTASRETKDMMLKKSDIIRCHLSGKTTYLIEPSLLSRMFT